MITGIHHISAFTKSAQINHHYYTDVLGLRFVKNTVNQQKTSIRHLFYGDYKATPGTQLTFFELKKAGQTYLRDNYFSTVTMNVPKDSLAFWKKRLENNHFHVQSSFDEDKLLFADPDGLLLALKEADDILPLERRTHHSSVPQDKQILRLSGIELFVKNPEATITFLTTFLGLQKSGNQVTDPLGRFETTVKQSTSAYKTRLGRGGIDHIAYTVDSIESLEALHQKALEMDVPIEMYVNRDYFKSLYVLEPNGLRIEIATKGPGFTIDESLEELGTSLALPSFLENKRAEIEAQLEEF